MLSWRRGSEEPECPASTVCIMLQIARLPYMAKGFLVAQLVKNLPACRKPGLDSWVGKILWRREQLSLQYSWASLVTQKVKNPPAMWETWVRSLGWEDPLEKGMATHSTSLAWTIPWTEEPGGLQCMGLHRVGQATFTSQPLPVTLLSLQIGPSAAGKQAQGSHWFCTVMSCMVTISHNVTVTEIMYTINVMCLSHPQTIPLPPGP